MENAAESSLRAGFRVFEFMNLLDPIFPLLTAVS